MRMRWLSYKSDGCCQNTQPAVWRCKVWRVRWISSHNRREEGILGFYKGGAASVLREATYSSFRMGMYEPIRHSIHRVSGLEEAHPGIKLGSAFAGGIGSAIFSPIDLVKVRFQSHLPKTPKPYASILGALAEIYRFCGIRGLYAGGLASPLISSDERAVGELRCVQKQSFSQAHAVSEREHVNARDG